MDEQGMMAEVEQEETLEPVRLERVDGLTVEDVRAVVSEELDANNKDVSNGVQDVVANALSAFGNETSAALREVRENQTTTVVQVAGEQWDAMNARMDDVMGIASYMNTFLLCAVLLLAALVGSTLFGFAFNGRPGSNE